MDLSMYLPDPADSSWIEKHTEQMGEVRFFAYGNKIWKKLMELKVGESLYVKDWVMPQNFDLFVKIAACFVSANSDWVFYENYSKIKHTHDSNEIRKSHELLIAKRRKAISERNGGTAESGREGSEILSAQGEDVSDQYQDESGLPVN